MKDLGAKDAAPPTDLELMMYFDGELEGDRLAAVEAFLAKEKAPRQKLAALDLAGSLVRDRATTKHDVADGIADSVMNLIDEPAKEAPADEKKVVRLPTKRARDNSRGVFVIAAAVVAAAAAVFLWSHASDNDEAARRRRPPSVLVEAPKTTAPPAATEAPKPDAPPAGVVHGVEVAAVNFGARTGAVFYVPSGTASSEETTTVVWLSDDDSAGGD